jgi:CO dehydrogenase nickel-insertion accessory protein CooC1
MNVLHIASNTDGYESVILIANRVSKKNQLSLIEKNGEQHMTGGFIITDSPLIRATLDTIPKHGQYDFVKQFKVDPFVKMYQEE